MNPPARFPDALQIAELFDAVSAGRTSALQRLLYIAPHAFHAVREPRSGRTVLQAALTTANTAVLDLLLQKQFPVNGSSADGQNLFHLASTASVASLIAQHAGSEAQGLLRDQDAAGNLPLHTAAEKTRVDCVSFYLNAMPDAATALTRPNRAGETPMHLIAVNTPQLLPQALMHHADPRIRNAAGATPRDLCTDAKISKLLRVYEMRAHGADEVARERLLEARAIASAATAAARAKAYVGASSA
ncbi:hypothetical protein ACSFA0_23760 [Variovorax sp. LT1P1]|uniref:hypothetical protein n=1 Tax=Variovorax sp. LT1P1 TaxID=3443730 RepID=UPI003F4470EC